MFDQLLNNSEVQVLKKLQDFSVLKQKVIANNIANIETPGFKAKDVVFKQEFQKALQQGEFDKAMRIEGRVVVRNDLSMRNDGNTVNLENEMLALQKNQMKFDIYTELLKSRYKKIKDLFTDLQK